MNFPKKQAQRLIPEYLLDYTTKLQTSHPDPTESWGGGSNYTAGNGIDITNNVISVDNTIAKKSEIPTKTSELTNDSDFITRTALNDYVTTTQLDNKLGDYALKTELPKNVSQLTNDSGYTTQTWVENQGYSKFSGSYNDLTNKPDLSIYAQSSNLSTVATSGSYNDLIDKPTIPDTSNLVTLDTDQTISGFKTFNNGLKWGMLGGAYTLQTIPVGFRFNFNDPQNPQQKDFSLPFEKSGTEYTIATTDDIHNPTITFTQGGTTKGTITLNQSGDQTIALDAGGGGGSSAPFEITNMQVDSSNQTITLTIVANS